MMTDESNTALTELLSGAEAVSSDVRASIDEMLRDGAENPMSADEVRGLLTKVVRVVRDGALKRGDAGNRQAAGFRCGGLRWPESSPDGLGLRRTRPARGEVMGLGRDESLALQESTQREPETRNTLRTQHSVLNRCPTRFQERAAHLYQRVLRELDLHQGNYRIAHDGASSSDRLSAPAKQHRSITGQPRQAIRAVLETRAFQMRAGEDVLAAVGVQTEVLLGCSAQVKPAPEPATQAERTVE